MSGVKPAFFTSQGHESGWACEDGEPALYMRRARCQRPSFSRKADYRRDGSYWIVACTRPQPAALLPVGNVQMTHRHGNLLPGLSTAIQSLCAAAEGRVPFRVKQLKICTVDILGSEKKHWGGAELRLQWGRRVVCSCTAALLVYFTLAIA